MRRVRAPLLLLVAVTLAFVGSACGPDDDTSTATTDTTEARTATGSITVSAAASLTEPFRAIDEAFRTANPEVTEVTFTFDSSGTLAAQIREGAPADVLASADQASMTEVVDADLAAGTPEVFARNQLAIVVKKGNPEGITSLADLADAGTVSLCGRDVPCGRYAEEALGKAGVTIPETSITRGQNAKATFTAVAEGDAVAGIVYVTDITGDATEAIVIPADQNVIATYPVAALSGSGNPATAEAFVAFLLAPEAQAILADAGFLPRTGPP